MHLKKQKQRPKRSLAALDLRQTAGGVVCKEGFPVGKFSRIWLGCKVQNEEELRDFCQVSHRRWAYGKVHPALLFECPHQSSQWNLISTQGSKRMEFNWVVTNIRGSYKIEALIQKDSDFIKRAETPGPGSPLCCGWRCSRPLPDANAMLFHF